jgi:hypothetical protein
MKTLKFALIAALVACTMISLANTDGFKEKPKKVITLTFEKAVHNPGLLLAMHQQLDKSILNCSQLVITGEVVYQGTLYRITGSYNQWFMFFSGKWDPLKDRKINIITSN